MGESLSSKKLAVALGWGMASPKAIPMVRDGMMDGPAGREMEGERVQGKVARARRGTEKSRRVI
jgi:hypothetical protein